MRKRICVIICTLMLVLSMSLALTACSNTSFKSITHIDGFDKIERIEIVQTDISTDGYISGAIVKNYTKEKEILEIYNILSKAKYSKDKVTDLEVVEYIIRIYVKGKTGYIEYQWDKQFKTSNDFNGSIKEGGYSMFDAHIQLEKLEKIFYRSF